LRATIHFKGKFALKAACCAAAAMLAALDQELAEVVDMDPEVRKQCVSRAKSAAGAKNKSHITQQSTSTDVAKQM
jgi:hypothetical protein